MKDIKSWLPDFKVSAENDQHLQKYFVKTHVVEDVLFSDKWLVIGRKGTGKTAIYEYLKNGNPHLLNGYIPVALNFKNYPWPIHLLYKESMESELTAYQKSWRYLFVVQAISSIIKYKQDILKEVLSKRLEITRKLLQEIYSNPFPTVIETIKSKLGRIQKVALPSGLAGEPKVEFSAGEISFEEISFSDELKMRLRSNAFNLLKYLENVLIEELASNKVLIILDQLDENWMEGEIPKYSKVLINLIQTAKDINFDKTLANSKVIIFLRSDIYDTLSFNDKTKIFEDSAIEIRWDESSLNTMFYERIRAFKPKDYQPKSQDSNYIFEAQRVRHGASPFRHVLRRSFYRPRDIIVFFNKIRVAHVETKSGLYVAKDLYSAEKDYSSSIYDELIDEWQNQKPEIKDYLNTLQNIGYQIFSLKNYFDKYKMIKPSVTKAEIQEILRFLFKTSVVGQKISARWEYACTNQHIQIDLEKPFHVNNGLKSRLVLTENREKRH